MTDSNRHLQALLWCIALLLPSADAPADTPLVFDQAIGHYRDLSYEALSDEGLSWEERVKLFGGETVHYAELSDKERADKELELKELLRRIGIADRMVHPKYSDAERTEAAVRVWLEAQTKQVPAAYSGSEAQKLRHAALGFFRAYELFGDKTYLAAGLTAADRILKEQLSRGHWSYGKQGDGMMRIQDGFVTRPFWIMLYAYKLSSDKKYFESARRAADVLLSAQSEGGGWPDQWIFPGGSTPSSGVRNGAIS
ncbi:MAG: pectate lyase [Planctomycetota bacterium]